MPRAHTLINGTTCRPSIAIIILTIASPLHANWWPTWTPTELRMVVGETRSVREEARWSGLVDYAGGIHWSFRTDNEQVAIAFARIESAAPFDVPIRAVGPGAASIKLVNSNGQLDGSVVYVRITVICGDEPVPRAPAQPLHAQAGQPIALSVLSEISDRTNYIWYLGHAGDRSHPIDCIGPEIAFRPASAGRQYVWVLARTVCTVGSAEFTIDVMPPRRRPSR